jgi:WD40 repeat protein/serine/threonine protein kinase
LLAEELDAAAHAALMEHVDECRLCQERLDRLTVPTATALPVFPTNVWRPDVEFVRQTVNSVSSAASADGEARAGWPQIPGFQILEELGRGGMGIVYRARQLNLNRLVALKLILPGSGANEEQRQRFRIEAEGVARLRHPNIIQVYEIGEQNGQAYLALEFVEGGSLAKRIQEGPQEPRLAAAHVEALARAIQVAHEAGIIHRDLKPANILLAHDESSRTSHLQIPKITDFGLAKLLNHDTELTRTGDVLGTPSYLAPEQAQPNLNAHGIGGGLGPAIDVYALGAILYELLTGRPPFHAETPMKTVLQVISQEPVSPSQLRPRLPRDLATICMKCLEKEPHKRYASALLLAEDLRRFRDSEPILARPVGTAGRLWRWSRRRPLLAGMAAALVLSLVGGLAGMSVLWLQAEALRRSAESHAVTADLRRQEAEANLYFSRLAQARLAWRLNDVEETQQLLEQCVPEPGATDWRGWEWRYLTSLGASALTTIPTVHAHVQSVAFSPDGRQLLLGGGDPYQLSGARGDAQVWNLAPLWDAGGTPEPIRTLADEPDLIFSLACSQDGKILATGSRKGAIHLWDAQGGLKLAALAGHSVRIVTVAFNADSSRLVSVDASGKAKVWDVRTGARLLECPAGWARFSPTGDSLLASPPPGDQTGVVTRWDVAGGRALGTLALGVQRWELSPDGQLLVAWDNRGVRIVDAATGKVTAVLSGHAGEVREARFSPDGLHVATAGADKTVRLWNGRTGSEEMVLRGHVGRVGCVAFHPSGRYLASGGHQPGDVRIWDLTRQPEFFTSGGVTGLPHSLPLDNFGPALALGFGPGNQTVRVVYRDQAIQTYDPRGVPLDEPTRWVPLVHAGPISLRAAALSADGRQLAGPISEDQTQVCIWDADSGERRQVLHGHTLPVTHMAWSRDGNRLVTTAVVRTQPRSRREVRIWDVSASTWLASFQLAEAPAAMPTVFNGVAALSPDGALVAYDDLDDPSDADARGNPSRVVVRTVPEGREVYRYAGHRTGIAALAFDPSGELLASAGTDGRLLIHDLETGRDFYSRPLKAPTAALGELAFSPDGRLLAAVDREQVKVWNVRWGQEVLVLRGAPPRTSDNAFPARLAWSSDGRYLLASNHDLTLSVWDSAAPASPAARIQAAEARAFSWHLANARLAADADPDGFSAQVHLKSLRSMTPSNAELAVQRGAFYARLGRWRDAAADYQVAADRHPLEHPRQVYEYALLRLYVGDHEGWRAACGYLRRQLDRTQDLVVAASLLRACCLGPQTEMPLDQLMRWEQTATRPLPPFALRGAIRYRAGRPADALQPAEAGLKKSMAGGKVPIDGLFLTLAYARLGRIEQARQTWSSVMKWLTDQGALRSDQPLNIIPRSSQWTHWLEAQILLSEAHALFRSVDAAPSEHRSP